MLVPLDNIKLGSEIKLVTGLGHMGGTDNINELPIALKSFLEFVR